MSRTFFLLGGYGNTGRLVADLLLRYTDAAVVVAGRSRERAQAAADALCAAHGTGRATAAQADAANARQLRRVLRGADFVVAASSTTALAGIVAEAALDAGADYLDTQLSSPGKHAALRALEPRIRREGRCFITDGGFHPGIPAAMVRYAAAHLGSLTRADVGSCIQIDWSDLRFSRNTAPEMMEEMRDYRARFFTGGEWVERMSYVQPFAFDPPFGTRSCYPMWLEEMQALPEQIPTLRRTGFFVSGFNPVVDYVVMPLGLVGMKLAPRLAVRPLSALFTWGLRRFSRPPYGVSLVLEAEGAHHGVAASARMVVKHPDGYFLTAAPVVACLMQYLGGHRPAGLWTQAQFVEPTAFFDALRALGVQVEAAGLDVPAPAVA